MADETEPAPARGFAPKLTSAQARALGRRGGHAKAAKRKLLDSLGLLSVGELKSFAPYRQAAEGYQKAQCAELAKAAGGELGVGPSLLVATGSLQVACSRFLIDRGIKTGAREDIEAGSRLANHARGSILAAHTLALPKEPGWRSTDPSNPVPPSSPEPASAPPDPLARWMGDPGEEPSE